MSEKNAKKARRQELMLTADVEFCCGCRYMRHLQYVDGPQGKKLIGECWLNPPVHQFVGLPMQEAPSLVGGQPKMGIHWSAQSAFVRVMGDWGCGRHEPRG